MNLTTTEKSLSLSFLLHRIAVRQLFTKLLVSKFCKWTHTILRAWHNPHRTTRIVRGYYPAVRTICIKFEIGNLQFHDIFWILTKKNYTSVVWFHDCQKNYIRRLALFFLISTFQTDDDIERIEGSVPPVAQWQIGCVILFCMILPPASHTEPLGHCI